MRDGCRWRRLALQLARAAFGARRSPDLDVASRHSLHPGQRSSIHSSPRCSPRHPCWPLQCVRPRSSSVADVSLAGTALVPTLRRPQRLSGPWRLVCLSVAHRVTVPDRHGLRWETVGPRVALHFPAALWDFEGAMPVACGASRLRCAIALRGDRLRRQGRELRLHRGGRRLPPTRPPSDLGCARPRVFVAERTQSPESC